MGINFKPSEEEKPSEGLIQNNIFTNFKTISSMFFKSNPTRSCETSILNSLFKGW